jgi:hypothetical protein
MIALAIAHAGLLAGCASSSPAYSGNTQTAEPADYYVPEGYEERLSFTDGLASEHHVSSEQRKQLQYYVSDTIRLVRSASGGQTGISNGRLVASSSQAVREVVIDSGTPGVVLASGPRWMAVSFEPGSYLYFVSEAPRSIWLGDEYVHDRYYLYLPDWNGNSGTVRLGNSNYVAVDGSARAHLMVDRESFSNVDARQSRQPGRLLYAPR